MSKTIEIKLGQKFGKLTVISFHHKKERVYGNRRRTFCYYLCKCDCGNETIVAKDFLIKKKNPTKSCGCISKNFLRSLTMTHGRGIAICNDWENDFISFYNWAIANGYREDLTIDRINNNGNYEPANCRWISVKGQHRNTRRNVFLIYNNEKRCVSEWAEILGVSKETLYGRIKKGWPVERILMKSPRKNGRG